MEGGTSSEYSDEEVGVVASGRRLWVRGVRHNTTCGDVVRALRDAPEAGSEYTDGEWVLAERWRGVERPLPSDASVLGVLAAWGDARHEVRLSLRRASSGDEDSGRESDSTSRRRRRRQRGGSPPAQRQDDPAARLAAVIHHQSRTIHQQLDKLREQEKLIDQLEDQTHKTRMEKHGTNYLLESYLRDLGRQEVQDSQAGNSDSGVGVGSGTPPRRHTKHRSRRERLLMREHYFTKELTDICQVNSERLKQITTTDTDSEPSADELTKLRDEIEMLEKLAIVNKRLHREEELVVRLTAKVKRYIDENKVYSCDNATQVLMLIDKKEQEIENTNKEMELNTVELAKMENELVDRMKLVDELTLELEQEEMQHVILEKQLNEASCRQPIALQDTYISILEKPTNDNAFQYSPTGYALDTLV